MMNREQLIRKAKKKRTGFFWKQDNRFNTIKINAMREIKFRAWDKVKQEMFDPMPIIDFKVFQINAIELMQFTGLKDRNGKEIYEGDVVERQIHYKRKYTVSWNENYCGFFPFLQHNLTDNNVALQFEIFGNIYENPELLNEEQEVKECDATKV